MQLKFVPDEPALLIEAPAHKAKGQKILVIADLHIGLERELARKGITVPSQLLKMQERLHRIIKGTGAGHVVILGDVKHEYAGVSWAELTEVPAFFARLLRKVKVSVVKGNHDGGIGSVLPKGVAVYEPAGFVLGDVLFTHGQAWPEKSALSARFLVMGHIHPAIEFWSAGARSVEHVWLRAAVDKAAFETKFKTKTNLETAIVVPVFNHLAGGFAFNSPGFRPIGPLLSKAIRWKNGKVFLLDGTFLGSLSSLPREKLKRS